MSGKYNRQIRKEVNSCYSQAFNQALVMIEAKAASANFFQRFRIAMKFLFKKNIRDLM